MSVGVASRIGPLVLVYVACLFVFGQAADANHRSADGYLGRTLPAWRSRSCFPAARGRDAGA